MLNPAQIAKIKTMDHDELLKFAQSEDMGVLVEVSYRLHRATVYLNGVLIALTAALVFFAWRL